MTCSRRLIEFAPLIAALLSRPRRTHSQSASSPSPSEGSRTRCRLRRPAYSNHVFQLREEGVSKAVRCLLDIDRLADSRGGSIHITTNRPPTQQSRPPQRSSSDRSHLETGRSREVGARRERRKQRRRTRLPSRWERHPATDFAVARARRCGGDGDRRRPRFVRKDMRAAKAACVRRQARSTRSQFAWRRPYRPRRPRNPRLRRRHAPRSWSWLQASPDQTPSRGWRLGCPSKDFFISP